MKLIKIETVVLYTIKYTDDERKRLVKLGFLPNANILPESLYPGPEHKWSSQDIEKMKALFEPGTIDWTEYDRAIAAPEPVNDPPSGAENAFAPELCGAENSIPFEYTTLGQRCTNPKPCSDHDESGNRRTPWG